MELVVVIILADTFLLTGRFSRALFAGIANIFILAGSLKEFISQFYSDLF